MRRSTKSLVPVVCLAIFLLSLGAGCSKDDDNGGDGGGGNPAEPTTPPPTIGLTLSNDAVNIGSQGSAQITAVDMADATFGISLRIQYDPDLVEITADSFQIGDFVSGNPIALMQTEEDMIFISVSGTTSGGKARAGTIGTFSFTGKAAGNCLFNPLKSRVRLVDGEGSVIAAPDLVTTGSTITVR